MTMLPTDRAALSKAIGVLRDDLVRALLDQVQGVYRWSVPLAQAGLDEAAATRRRRLEGWVHEQGAAYPTRTRDQHLEAVVRQAAYTQLNRHVILRILEAAPPGERPLRPTPVLTGGKRSRGYRDFRGLAPALVETLNEGYTLLLDLVFEDLALELPGLFGGGGVVDVVPMGVATLNRLVDALDAAELAPCWTDDMTLGWVYQYWNDPDRATLDARLTEGGKIDRHELASKTQLFTERCMVDWLLQNSLGPLWRAICARNGWTPEVVADGTLARLEERRVEWRTKREAGEVSKTALMPLQTDSERRWAYHLDQPPPEDAPRRAPESIRDLRMIDPAVGSGHFLVVAMDLLFALYREEARHRGEAGGPKWSDRAIVERILAHNLAGIDLDARAVQIAAAALWLKAQRLAPGARLGQLRLVASDFGFANLADNAAGILQLREDLWQEVGIPAALTEEIVRGLRNADHMGSLLPVQRTVDEAIRKHEASLGRATPTQGGLWGGYEARPRTTLGAEEAKTTLLDRLEDFLSRHTRGDDLGLRMHGAQLSAGVRYLRMLEEGAYDLVVANPPYLAAKKMRHPEQLAKAYPRGKVDLYSAFLERGLQLARPGGISAMVTMRGWMFIKQFEGLRKWLLEENELRVLGDYDTGAFEEIGGDVVTVTSSVIRRGRSAETGATIVAQRLVDGGVAQKRAESLAGSGIHRFDLNALKIVPGWPLVYWWDDRLFGMFRDLPLLGSIAPAKQGMATADNGRFLRYPWEVRTRRWSIFKDKDPMPEHINGWVPYVKGAAGDAWIEPLQDLLDWNMCGVGNRELSGSTAGKNASFYFLPAVAFTKIGSNFSARAYRHRSAFDVAGSSVFLPDTRAVTTMMNSRRARDILESLNPTVNFQVGDVNRLPLFSIQSASAIFTLLDEAFTLRESHREPSVEFKQPGPSPWRHAQDWAQAAVDRPEGAPLPEYIEELDSEPAWHHLSYALGISLGRFHPEGQGVLDPATADLSHALPGGILMLDGTLDPQAQTGDDLSHPACAPLRAAWAAHRDALGTDCATLRDWLCAKFFSLHKPMYKSRPIHWPLCSKRKTFVAWVTIHRMDAGTLLEVQSRLLDTKGRLLGERKDLELARSDADPKRRRAAEQRYARVKEHLDELGAFTDQLEACASFGPPRPETPASEPRQVSATHAPVLDDGVAANSAALWPLLDPVWKEPRKLWAEISRGGLSNAKDHDWSQLARRYWPARVDAKSQRDPSLAVAHGCFWLYHPARAWAWELRLQDEIGPDFRIVEAPYAAGPDAPPSGDHHALRAEWLLAQPQTALDAVEKEALRRASKRRYTDLPEMALLERGLWGADPRRCGAIERKVSEALGVEFFLRAPDEPVARSAWAASNPDHVEDRAKWVARLKPRAELFPASDDEVAADGAEEDDDE